MSLVIIVQEKTYLIGLKNDESHYSRYGTGSAVDRLLRNEINCTSEVLLDRLYLLISTDLLRQQVVDFSVSWIRRTPITSTFAPPGVTPPFANHFATVPLQVFQQFNPFHAMTTVSS